MGDTLRILHTADSHIGADLPARQRKRGARRGDDFVDSFTRVIHAGIERSVDLVLHCGDLFDIPDPHSRALAAAAGPILEAATAGIPVVIVPGNHERSAIPSTLLLAHPNIHIVTEPTTFTFRIRGLRVAVASFPCLRRESALKFDKTLEETGWQRAKGDVNILAVHETFESATCGPADYRFRSDENVIERWAVPDAFHYVAAGHIHRQQVLSTSNGDGPPIVYCGSPDRVSFAEISEPKGYMLIEERGGRLEHRFIEHDVRPMSTWPVDVTGLSPKQIMERVESIVTELPPRSIAQLRLTGRSTRAAMKGLRFATRAQELRPDILFSAAVQSIDFRAGTTAANGFAADAFSYLDGPAETILQASIDELPRLPNVCGVYALYDAIDRLLYIGKSKTVRTRIRSHLNKKGRGANEFRGWAREIARVEVFQTGGELEALLVEADLIRKLRPPFNRQMRRWSACCYISENGRPFGQLSVTDQPPSRKRCYGPFRSRRSAEDLLDTVSAFFGVALCPEDWLDTNRQGSLVATWNGQWCERHEWGGCEAPCAQRIAGSKYTIQLEARNSFMAGRDDARLRELETRVESASDDTITDDDRTAMTRRARTLRAAFDYLQTLADAENMMNCWLTLPGDEGAVRLALLGANGVQFDELRHDERDARRFLDRHAASARPRGVRVPPVVLDAMCIVARHLRTTGDEHRLIPGGELKNLSTSQLLSRAFGDDR